ncbi:MAG: restriction endonuclease subunit S [Nitrospira sp.]|nr:restriction endonuclease subunit S [Nitrospira sp.]
MKNVVSVSLADIAESIQYGYTASASKTEVGPKFLRITDIVPHQIDYLTVPYCEIDEKNFAKFSLASGDIVIARTGATVGYAKLIRNNEPSVFASYLVRIRIDSDKADSGYVGRVVESDLYKRFVRSRVGGAAQPNANAKVLSSFRLPLPKRSIQIRIASILSTYDDLIENNRRRIRLLEKAARLLYKEWFVHFRFPGHECITVTNGVPDGWKKEKVSAHVDFVRGVEPGSKNYMQVSDEMLVPFLRVGDFGNRISNIFIDATFAEGKMLKSEDVAITMDGTPGLVGFGMTGAFSSGIRKVVPKDNCGIGWSFIYTLLKSESIQATVARFAKGTTILHASSSIDHMVFLQPHQGILGVFEDVTGSLLRQVLLLDQQNRKLVKARDLLLPRLMNGAVTV